MVLETICNNVSNSQSQMTLKILCARNSTVKWSIQPFAKTCTALPEQEENQLDFCQINKQSAPESSLLVRHAKLLENMEATKPAIDLRPEGFADTFAEVHCAEPKARVSHSRTKRSLSQLAYPRMVGLNGPCGLTAGGRSMWTAGCAWSVLLCSKESGHYSRMFLKRLKTRQIRTYQRARPLRTVRSCISSIFSCTDLATVPAVADMGQYSKKLVSLTWDLFQTAE
jgi:hypothetical protein